MGPDYKVYNHFKPIFERKLETFGQGRMGEEIRELRRVNEEVMARCKFSQVDNDKLSGANKWWGSANLMGYLVLFSSYSVFSLSLFLSQGGGRGG